MFSDNHFMNLTNWRSQIRKGLIEFCLLNIIEQKKQAYGLELIEGLSDIQLPIGEGTLYPLLSRLVRDKYLQPRWETPDIGHPRKYYRLTPLGKKTLIEMRREWCGLTKSINSLYQENNRGENWYVKQ